MANRPMHNLAERMIKAVIYDVDGTMVNSEPIHVAAWDKALQQYGTALSRLSEEFQATMAGKKPIVIAEGMIKELNLLITPEQLLEKKSALFIEAAKTSLEPMPGVVESIHRLSMAGYRLASGTSLDRDYLDFILNKLKVTNLFEVIVTGDQIKNGKPHPETYLTVCERLNLEPKECIVIEDAQSGIQAAKAADAWCLAIKNADAVTQNTSEADLALNSLHEITHELIQSLN